MLFRNGLDSVELSAYLLPAFLAQASLQYFDLASNVVYFFLQTGHFFSIQIAFFVDLISASII